MTLVPGRTPRVSGTAVDSTGKPFAGATILVTERQGLGMMMPGGNQVKPDGSFVVSGLASGEYTLQVTMLGALGESEFSSTGISMSGNDINDVRLVGSSGRSPFRSSRWS